MVILLILTSIGPTIVALFLNKILLIPNARDAKNMTKVEDDNGIYVPFNHTELADYLCVNRSALVRELGRMKNEHILDINKNMFYIL